MVLTANFYLTSILNLCHVYSSSHEVFQVTCDVTITRVEVTISENKLFTHYFYLCYSYFLGNYSTYAIPGFLLEVSWLLKYDYILPVSL